MIAMSTLAKPLVSTLSAQSSKLSLILAALLPHWAVPVRVSAVSYTHLAKMRTKAVVVSHSSMAAGSRSLKSCRCALIASCTDVYKRQPPSS